MGLSHRYCCVAIPLYNVGVYAILVEQFVAAIVIGVLNFSAPDIVAVDIPSFGAALVGVLCILTAVLQAWGFWGVYKEKPANFRLFVRTNFALVALSLLLPLVWIILSAAKHEDVKNDCVTQFSSDNSSVDGDTICNIFTWIQLGVMGLLWVMFFVGQMYFCNVLRIYSLEQRNDHAKYNSIYSAAGEDLAKSGLWDNGAAEDATNAPSRPFMSNHERTASGVSKSSSLRNELPVDNVSYEKTPYGHHQYTGSASDVYGQEQPQQQPYYGHTQQEPQHSHVDLLDHSYSSDQPQHYSDSYYPQQPAQDTGYYGHHQQQRATSPYSIPYNNSNSR